MLFIEICYIPNFMINIAASQKFRANKVYFDNQKMRLHTNNKMLGLVKHQFDYDLLKDNTTIDDQKEIQENFSAMIINLQKSETVQY